MPDKKCSTHVAHDATRVASTQARADLHEHPAEVGEGIGDLDDVGNDGDVAFKSRSKLSVAVNIRFRSRLRTYARMCALESTCGEANKIIHTMKHPHSLFLPHFHWQP